MTTQQLLDCYYEGFAKKAGWETHLAEDFQFVGGNMQKPEPIVGRDAYIAIGQRFGKLYTAMHVKTRIVEGEKACVVAHYEYVFPGGRKTSGDVAEVWTVKAGRLASLTIFFDTLSFKEFTL